MCAVFSQLREEIGSNPSGMTQHRIGEIWIVSRARSTRSVFERYAIVNRGDMVDAMQKLQRCEDDHRRVTRLVTLQARTPQPFCLAPELVKWMR